MQPTQQPLAPLMLAFVLAGGRVHVDDWKAHGVSLGYRSRGLAGFFGGRSPSMVSEGPWRVLTDRGRERLQHR